MQLNAKARLLSQGGDAISYEQYARVVAMLDHDPRQVHAFDLKVPGALKKLWSELKAVASLLKESADIAVEAVIKAFQEKSVFRLLKGVGFSLSKLLKAVKVAAAIPAQTLFAAIDDLIDAFGSSASLQKLNVHERVAKLDAIIHRHPVLTKLTGVAVAGFLVWAYLHASSTGHADYDLGIVEAVINCVHGDYSLADMFASKQGIKDISVLLFGLATGGAGITSYGAGRIESLLHFLGKHSGEVASLLIALFYTGARKLGLHIDYSHEPQELKSALVHEPADKAGRTQRWYNRLTGPERDAYRAKFPGTRFHDKTSIILPKA